MHGGENRRFLFLSIRVQHGRFAFGHSPTRPRLCADSPSPSDSESEAMKSQMLPRDASESYPPELSRAGGSWGRSRGGGPSPFAPAAAASFASSATSHELPQYVRSCLSKRLCDVAFGALYCRPTARRCPPRGFGFGAVMRRVHATRARVSCTRLSETKGGLVGDGIRADASVRSMSDTPPFRPAVPCRLRGPRVTGVINWSFDQLN